MPILGKTYLRKSIGNPKKISSHPLYINISILGGLELKSTPNMFGAIGSDFGKRLAAAVSKPDQMPGLGSHLAPGTNTWFLISKWIYIEKNAYLL